MFESRDQRSHMVTTAGPDVGRVPRLTAEKIKGSSPSSEVTGGEGAVDHSLTTYRLGIRFMFTLNR